MSNYTLDFESSLKEIEDKIDSIKATGIKTGMDVTDAVTKLEDQLSEEKKILYANLSRWERVQLARHPKRPYSSDYISRIPDFWLELHGERYFTDDIMKQLEDAVFQEFNYGSKKGEKDEKRKKGQIEP